MSLTIIEKAGAVAAFVPLFSSVSSLIKAYVYYNRCKGPKNEQIEKNAGKIESLKTLLDLKKDEITHYQRLWIASLVEAVPLVNVIAAIFSCIVLLRLSKARQQIEQNYLTVFHKFKDSHPKEMKGIDLFPDEERNVLMLSVIAQLEQQISITNLQEEAVILPGSFD